MNNFRLAPGLRNLLILLTFLGTSACTEPELLVLQGQPGTPGENCSVETVVGGVLIKCADSMAVVYNGIDGKDGLDGAPGAPGQNAPPTPYTVTEIVDPCGPGPGFNEVLLKMQNGQIIAYFEQGGNRFLSLLISGNYQTTDSQKCTFQVGPPPGFAITW